MRAINLVTHCLACEGMDENNLKKYNLCESHSEKSNVRKDEEKDLKRFVSNSNFNSFLLYEYYFWNYSIPQISKEFDLLRIGKDSVVNIELKRNADEEKIKKQLKQNNYYLKSLNRKLNIFCYLTKDNILYEYNCEENDLQNVSFNDLKNILDNQSDLIEEDIDDLFEPSKFLVSPFNKMCEFLNDKYFLTDQQVNIKKEILTILNRKVSKSVSVTGPAGCGKTLLIYDIAKKYKKERKNVVIIHCGKLNEGHNALNRKNWKIFPIKSFKEIQYANVDILILDETQRIDENQLNLIIEEINKNNIKVIFSYDPVQIMNYKEKNSHSLEIIDNYVNKKFKIKGRIRANKEVYYFVDSLFGLSHRHINQNYKNIYLTKFKTYEQSLHFLNYLKEQGWNFINYTPSIYHSSRFMCLNGVALGNSHEVIGQEFEKVVVIIDENFKYKNNRLEAGTWNSGNYGARMLYQAITRAKDELYIIVINNNILFNHCMNIINNYKDNL